MRILVLNPFNGETRERAHCEQIARPDTEVEFDTVGDVYPLPYVQYRYFRHCCADATIDRIVRAEREGFDGVLIACMYDPGLIEARELVDIPVVGAFESSFHYAAMLGGSFGLFTVEQNVVPVTWEMARLYGVSEKLRSVKHIGVSAAHLYDDVTPPEVIVKRTLAATRAFLAEGCEAVLLGCTLIGTVLTETFADPAAELGIPIVDPLLPAFKTTEMLVDLHQRTRLPAVSRVGAYAAPPRADVAALRGHYGKDAVASATAG